MTPSKSLPLSVGLALSLLFGSSVSAADVSSKDTALARSLFREARKLMTDKQYATACPKLEESQRLDPGVGTEFNLADCWEHLGKTASAWALFLDVAAATRAAGQSERESLARQRAEALEARLSKLRLRVTARDPALAITRDGAELGRASWTSEFPVDPGTTVLEAKAPGKQTWTQQVTIPNAAVVTTVTVPELTPSSDQLVAKKAEGTPPAISSQTGVLTSPPSERSPAGKGQRLAALGLAGAGLVGAVVGTVFLVRYNSKNSEAKSVCPASENCSSGDQGRHDGLIADARSSAPWVYVGFGAGSAALIAASVLYFTAPSERAGSPGAQALTAAPFAGPSEAGAVVRGRF